jgi:hypothetical protein
MKVLFGAIPRWILLLKSHPPSTGWSSEQMTSFLSSGWLKLHRLHLWRPLIQETTGLQRHDFRDVESTWDTFWRRQA